MHGTLSANGSTAAVTVDSKTHVHADGAFGSGTLNLEYLSGDSTWRAIAGESYTADADKFLDITYGMQVRLTLTGATAPSIFYEIT